MEEIMKMVEFYDRLDEIDGVTRVLIEDVKRARSLAADEISISMDEKTNCRFYVRAVRACGSSGRTAQTVIT